MANVGRPALANLLATHPLLDAWKAVSGTMGRGAVLPIQLHTEDVEGVGALLALQRQPIDFQGGIVALASVAVTQRWLVHAVLSTGRCRVFSVFVLVDAFEITDALIGRGTRRRNVLAGQRRGLPHAGLLARSAYVGCGGLADFLALNPFVDVWKAVSDTMGRFAVLPIQLHAESVEAFGAGFSPERQPIDLGGNIGAFAHVAFVLIGAHLTQRLLHAVLPALLGTVGPTLLSTTLNLHIGR